MTNHASPPLALLFPGQGSQEKGMGRDLAEASPEIMDLWKKAEKISKTALREIYWDGDDKAMAETRWLQPALCVADLSVWIALAPKLSRPKSELRLAGHSLGEYPALAAAGVLSADDLLELVCLRGRLMAEVDPQGRGKMAAVVKLAQPAVEEIVAQVADTHGELRIANFNSPGQVVGSGVAEAVDACAAPVKEAKGRLIPLAVSGAFHSPLMAEAAKELAAFMKTRTWNAPSMPVFCNVTARPESDADMLREVMSRQMTSSVLWIQIVRNLWADGVRAFVELGPKTVLTKLLKPNLEGAAEAWSSASLSSAGDVGSFSEGFGG